MKLNEAFPSQYLAASDLGGKSRRLTIASYSLEEIGQGADKKEKPILHFRGAKKGLVLNVTNGNIISEVLGTDELDDWVGQEIVLYPARVEFQGRIVDAIRVKMEARAIEEEAPAGDEPPPPNDDDMVPF